MIFHFHSPFLLFRYKYAQNKSCIETGNGKGGNKRVKYVKAGFYLTKLIMTLIIIVSIEIFSIRRNSI